MLKFNFDASKIINEKEILEDLDKAFRGAAESTRDRTKRRISELGRVRSGQMRDGIAVRRNGPLDYTVFGRAKHTGIQEHGSGRIRAGNFMKDSLNKLEEKDFRS